MPAAEKELLLNQLNELADHASYIFFARFKGVSANDLGALRRKLEKNVEKVLVCKNSIARLVLERVKGTAAQEFLDGQVILTIGKNDPQIVSKLLLEFAKDRENFELKGIFLDRNVFKKQFIHDLSKLPSQKELLATVACGMKAPINNFVLGLGQLLRSLVNVLDQVQKSKSTSQS